MARTKGAAIRNKTIGKETASGDVVIAGQKKKRSRHGALSQLRKYRSDAIRLSKQTTSLMPKLPFDRVVREVAQNFKSDVRFTKDAMQAVQEITEAWFTTVFDDTVKLAIHAGRQTIMPGDLKMILHYTERKMPELASVVRARMKRLTVREGKRKGAVKIMPLAIMTREDLEIEEAKLQMQAQQLKTTGALL